MPWAEPHLGADALGRPRNVRVASPVRGPQL